MRFIALAAGSNPIPSCPHCGEGAPYRLLGCSLCNHCTSKVSEHDLLLWPLHLEAFLQWLAEQLHLRDSVRRIEAHLWQLGTWQGGEEVRECFFQRPGLLSEAERTRLSAYRNLLLLFALTPPAQEESRRGRCVSLLELLVMDRSLLVRDVRVLLQTRGAVRFDAGSGALLIGDHAMGEVPVGSKEFFFLLCLSHDLDHFVPYVDLKRFVLQHTGSRDTTEEATFCHRLKNRIKKRWVPQIDQFLSTTNKGDGYRLRAYSQQEA